MQKTSKIPLDRLLFAIAFIIAIAVRLFKLAQIPLSDTEAELALQALGLVQGNTQVMLAGQPGYILPTTALFAVFKAGNAIARFIPALAGAFLVLIPVFFKRELGTWAAVLFAFGLGLDPGLTALSRQASGVTWAVFFALLTLVGLIHKKPILTGISLGLSIIAGQYFWQGFLIGLFGYGFFILLMRSNKSKEVKPLPEPPQRSRPFWMVAWPWALGSLILGGTLFFFVPRGISAVGSGLIDYVNGWQQVSGTTISRLLLALVGYELLPLIFGMAQILRSLFMREKHPVDMALIFWWLAALMLGLINPAHSEVNLIWVVIPMWGLTARWLSDMVVPRNLEYRPLAAAQAVVVFVLIVFAWLNFIGLLDLSRPPDEIRLRWIGASGALLLAVASVLLVRWGWSKAAARYGVIWAAIALLSLWSFSSLVNAAGLDKQVESQLWRTGPVVSEEDLLFISLGDASEWNTGRRDTLDLSVIDLPSPALHWSLRDYISVEYYDVVPLGSSPSMVITKEMSSPGMGAGLRLGGPTELVIDDRQ
jgi:hypothetical protein